MPRPGFLPHLLALGTWLYPSASLAQPKEGGEPVRATVVGIDGADVFVDVDRSRVQPGTELTVYRRVEVRHPVSGQKLSDRFPIGRLRIARASETLSLARVEGEPRHPVAVGDAAEARAAPSPDPDPLASQSPSKAAAPPQPARASDPDGRLPSTHAATPAPDAETRDLMDHYYATLGKPPAVRAALYRRYLARHPQSRYAARVNSEVAWLERLAARPDQAPGPAPRGLAGAVRIDPLERVRVGEAVKLAAAHDPDAEVRSLLVHARATGAEPYTTRPMELDGRGHARAQLPGALAGDHGLEYFVEAVAEDGRTAPVIARADRPLHARGVPAGEGPAPRPGPSIRVRFSSELVSFDGTTGRDYFLLNEGDFLYRVRMGSLHAVRMGYGHYRGQGGTVEELDELELEPRQAGFSYGFAQADLELSELIGASLRATLGLGRPEQADRQRDGVTGGFQLRARIGQADGTHLVLAGELMPEIGQRAFIGLRWEAVERMPMGAEVQVTDQPVNSDELAVRLVYEAGYRVTDRIALALRPSYQLRTIEHAGPGIGMSATFDW